MTMPDITMLPNTLVPFSVSRLKEHTLIWNNPEYPISEVYLRSSILFKSVADAPPDNEFFADCYGGGLAGNGGSARCGFNGKFQIKGVGLTPLIGKRTDSYHSSGKLSCAQALVESLWTMALKACLPYGVVDVVAVIDLVAPIPGEFFHQLDTEALLVRTAPIRLAHFERAYRFVPLEINKDKIPRDSIRVKSCINMFENFVAEYKELDNQQFATTLESSIFEVTGRLARQMAFCTANSLKVSTTPSNISLDGRLLDLTNTFCLSWLAKTDPDSYVRYYRGGLGEQTSLLDTLSNICYYINKYRNEDVSKIKFGDIRRFYMSKYINCLGDYILAKAGVPPRLRRLITKETRVQISKLFLKCVKNPHSILFAWSADDLPGLYTALSYAFESGRSCDVTPECIDSHLLIRTLSAEILLALRAIPNDEDRRWETKAILFRSYQHFAFVEKLHYDHINCVINSVLCSTDAREKSGVYADGVAKISQLAKITFSNDIDCLVLFEDETHRVIQKSHSLIIEESKAEGGRTFLYNSLIDFLNCGSERSQQFSSLYPKHVLSLIS